MVPQVMVVYKSSWCDSNMHPVLRTIALKEFWKFLPPPLPRVFGIIFKISVLGRSWIIFEPQTWISSRFVVTVLRKPPHNLRFSKHSLQYLKIFCPLSLYLSLSLFLSRSLSLFLFFLFLFIKSGLEGVAVLVIDFVLSLMCQVTFSVICHNFAAFWFLGPDVEFFKSASNEKLRSISFL